MIRKDYIQRYLDELTKVLAKILQFKQNNEPEKANQQLDEFGNNFLTIDLNELIDQPPHTVITNLIEIREFELTHFKILEELLYQKHLLAPNDVNLKKITLEIVKYVAENDKDFSLERQNKINLLS